MHFLPFFMTLLLLLATANSSLLKKKQHSSKLHSSFCSYMQANRNAQSKVEDEVYKEQAIPDKTTSPAKGEEQKRGQKSPSSRLSQDWNWNREQKFCAKLNLYPLLQPIPSQSLEKLLIEMLDLFYGGKNFYHHQSHKNLSLVFAKEIMKGLRVQKEEKEDEVLYLEKIAFSDPALQAIFYKMLQGSIDYHFLHRIGYPSLLDFVIVTPSNANKKMICINHASFEMFYLLFGPFTPILIEEMKNQDKDHLTETLFKECLVKTPELEMDKERQNLIAFSHPKNVRNPITVKGKDNKNTLSLTRTIYK